MFSTFKSWLRAQVRANEEFVPTYVLLNKNVDPQAKSGGPSKHTAGRKGHRFGQTKKARKIAKESRRINRNRN